MPSFFVRRSVFPLLELDDDVMAHVLSFVDTIDLARVGAASRSARGPVNREVTRRMARLPVLDLPVRRTVLVAAHSAIHLRHAEALALAAQFDVDTGWMAGSFTLAERADRFSLRDYQCRAPGSRSGEHAMFTYMDNIAWDHSD